MPYSIIIVSAGAGSGKTAVLTQRVITKLKNGININNLLILTFTNAAAAEMKERIRNAIKKDPELTYQLDYINSAYITTFDSFALSIVKKYHDRLNLKKEVSIVDENAITPWRFDVARNKSMELIPKDADILVCTDFDELFEPGWATFLRNNWIVGQHNRCHYTYA